MKPTLEQAIHINTLFNEMQSKNDFLELLNYAKSILYKEKSIPFELRQLNRYINTRSKPKTSWELLNKKKFKHRQKNYIEFTIPKKSGGIRTISAPKPGLKAFQHCLNLILQSVFEPHQNATGFIVGKSIIDNAKKHVGQNYVYNIDLADFFPSIPQQRVWGRLHVHPFNLGNTSDRKKIASMIAVICCMETPSVRPKGIYQQDGKMKLDIIKKSVLPQGAPTSPILTNAICSRLDLLLTGLAKRFNLNYSRYADDITFSSMHNTHTNSKGVVEAIYKTGNTFDLELRRIIKDQNFKINEDKVRLQKRGYRQEVTGIVVNEKLNVHQNYIKSLRSWIYKWERYGYPKTKKMYISSLKKRNGDIFSELSMVLEGKILYLEMVKGKKNSTVIKLRKRYDKLYKSLSELPKPETKKRNVIDVSKFIDEKPINNQKIVDLILNEGVEKAMKYYKSEG